jgi:sodium/hydrogen exchanger 8
VKERNADNFVDYNHMICILFLFLSVLQGFCSGVLVLLVSKGQNSHILQFDEELFFIYLLPPIIFNAGFQVKKKQFFRNFIAIMLFGVVGVFISFGIISAGTRYMFTKLGLKKLSMRDYLAIGTIFSATDSVCTLQVGPLVIKHLLQNPPYFHK